METDQEDDSPQRETDNFLSVKNGVFSRRSSLRASVSSIDSSFMAKPKEEFCLKEIPDSDESLLEYVRNLTEACKRSYQLKDVLNETWMKDEPNQSTEKGNTLLHIATKLNELKLVTIICHNFHDLNIDFTNQDGNTALHFAAEKSNPLFVETLLKHGSRATKMQNKFGLSPLQVAAFKCNQSCMETLLKNHDSDRLQLTDNQETLLHLACKGSLTRILSAKDDMNARLEDFEEISTCQIIEESMKDVEFELLKKTYPCLDFILELFKKNPDYLEMEDSLSTSPGLILHYFTCLNHIQGVKTVLAEPFLVSPNVLNKNKLSALWIASWYNMTNLGKVLLHHGADPNVRDDNVGYTPLHNAVLGYHIQRIDETCDFIDALLEHGADPKAIDNSGETPPHLSIGTLDFRLMSKFLEYLGPDVLQIQDETGNTLFHYAVGYLDEDSIFYMMSKGVDFMCTNCTEVAIDQEDFGFATNELVTGFQMLQFRQDQQVLKRSKSVTIKRIPLQEAMKNGNSTAYFNALRRLDLKDVMSRMSKQDGFRFISMHLTAATREVRPDIVRILFHHVQDRNQLHHVLLFKDLYNDDETFTKTALEWAVENNDRLCTTEILHQEYACHVNDRKQGLNCLRQQLNGDELLTWTIETFTMFYEKTWAQSFMFPLLGVIPVFFSICTFVYDYYSDFELTYEYYQSAFLTHRDALSNDSDYYREDIFQFEELCQRYNESHFILTDDLLKKCFEENLRRRANFSSFPKDPNCVDIQRTSEEYRTAFFVNIICVSLPVLVFYLMASRELWDKLQNINKTYPNIPYIVLKLIYWPLTLICAPFFILYIAIRQLIFKFQHLKAKRKNKVRRQLQKSEYLWGISRTAEASLESCGQLVLQIWLLSSDFNSLSKDTFAELIDKTYNGIIFFLSFSFKEANDIEKSLGKMFMSLVALVCGVAASYRTLKRGAVKWNHTLFIYFSLAFQIFARIFSLGLFFFTARNFMPTVPILVSIHFALVFILKWTFERARHTHGMMALLVAVLNIFASSLVYVRILPIDKQVEVKAKGIQDRVIRKTQQHSTFFVQSLFFLLVFVENIILAAWPLIKGQSNRAISCLGPEKLTEYLFMVAGLCICSWICHILYYKYMGHPWTEVNGPLLSSKGIKCNLHLCGTEKYLYCTCCAISIKTVPDDIDFCQDLVSL